MVKMQAVQSALAIRRQRTRQEEARRARQRRESGTSEISTPRASVVSIDGQVYFDERRESKRTVGHVTMFHVGGVLILIGLMLVITSLMPSYVKSTTMKKRNDLLGTGSFFVFLGGLLTTISRFISNNEDKELHQYIKGRLYRTRSGHRLRDPEACMSPHRERHKSSHNGVHSSHHHHVEPAVHSHKNGHVAADNRAQEGQSSHHHPQEAVPVATVEAGLPHSASSEPVLSRILEEDEECDASTEPPPPDSSCSFTQ